MAQLAGSVIKRQPSSFHEQVYVLLRQAIIEGRLRPGERLVESRLASDLRISRAPVREALRKLERDGLVAVWGGKGLRVVRLSVDQVAELYACRAALERLAAQEAAQAVARGEPGAGQAVRAIEQALELEASRIRARASVSELVEATNGFHNAVVRASGNQCLAELMTGLQDRIVQARRTSLSVSGNPRRFHEHHRQVLEAIRAGQAVRAGQLMEAHILDARERVTRFLAAHRVDAGAQGRGEALETDRGG